MTSAPPDLSLLAEIKRGHASGFAVGGVQRRLGLARTRGGLSTVQW
jgi:hypothetical protein